MDMLFSGLLMLAAITGIAVVIATIGEMLDHFKEEKETQNKDVFYTYRDWSPNAKDGKL